VLFRSCTVFAMGNPVICDPGNCKTSGQNLFEKNTKKMNDALCHTQPHILFDSVCLRINMRHSIQTSEANNLFQGSHINYT